MKKKQLRKSEVKDLNKALLNRYLIKDMFDKKKQIFSIEDNGMRLIVLDNEALFFYDGDSIVPTLKGLKFDKISNVLKKITIDMGAIKFISKGADVMRPGITNIEEGIGSEEYVAVVDEKNGVYLSVSKTIFSGAVIKGMDQGKVLKNLHYAGDAIWNFK